eukprot:206382-Rhodomonas_salina.1
MDSVGEDHGDKLEAVMFVVSGIDLLLVEVRVLVPVPSSWARCDLKLAITERDDVIMAAALGR